MANNYTYGAIRQDKEVPYIGFGVGWTPKAKSPILHPAEGNKKEWVENSINTQTSVAELFARANGDYKEGETYDDNPFLTMAAFQGTGKHLSEVAPGTRIAVAGPLSKSDWTAKKDGSKHTTFRVLVDAMQILGDGATLNRFCGFSTRVYQDRTFGMVNLLMAKVTKVGDLGTDRNGRSYLFVQAETAIDGTEILDRANGTWSKEKSYYKSGRITLVFSGKAAESRANTLKEGQLLCVTGMVERNEYQGKVYCRVRVDRAIVCGDTSASGGKADGGKTAPKKTAPKKAAPAEPDTPDVPDTPDAGDDPDAAPPVDDFGLGEEDGDDDLPF